MSAVLSTALLTSSFYFRIFFRAAPLLGWLFPSAQHLLYFFFRETHTYLNNGPLFASPKKVHGGIQKCVPPFSCVFSNLSNQLFCMAMCAPGYSPQQLQQVPASGAASRIPSQSICLRSVCLSQASRSVSVFILKCHRPLAFNWFAILMRSMSYPLCCLEAFS